MKDCCGRWQHNGASWLGPVPVEMSLVGSQILRTDVEQSHCVRADIRMMELCLHKFRVVVLSAPECTRLGLRVLHEKGS